MEPTNEERVELHQLQNRRFWCTAAAVVGVVLLAVTAAGQAAGGMAVVGLVLLIGGVAFRAMTSSRIQLAEARVRDRVTRFS